MKAPSEIPLKTVVTYLDSLLRVTEIPDHDNAINGLQVENRGMVRRIVAAVDASQATIDGAVSGEPGPGTLLIVHHGLFWDGNIPLTARRYRRVRALLENDIAIYSAHIPLDLHPDVGNSISLARLIGLDVQGWFGLHRGVLIGVHGRLSAHRDELVRSLNTMLNTESTLIAGGPERTERIGIITGAAGNAIADARNAGLDTFITGEGAHHTYFDAVEWGINVIYAGHYATEKLGVQRLAEHLSARYGVPWEFHEHDTGL